MPHAFLARMRAKKLFDTAPVTICVVVDAPPRSLFPTFERPGANPASRIYAPGDPAGTFHDSVSRPLPWMACRLPGAPGGVVHPTPTVTTASLDGALSPAEFDARTRTKYVPAAIPPAE